MEEWKEYKLEELSIGKGSYGIGASAVPYSPSLHTYLRITDINDDGTLNKNGLMSLDDENADDYILQPNDIVFARTGNSTGRSYFYDGSDGKLVYAGFLIKFSLDSKKVNPRILKYYTHSKPYFDWVCSFDTGGTRGNINARTYGDMPIVLPPRKLQDKIVSILKSLDDKIEVNRKINENLEQQAQALFKSWFVDFEPFKNGEFVESELGMIPKGWRVESLTSFGRIVCGKTPSKSESSYYGGNIPFIKIPDMHNMVFVGLSEDSLSQMGDESQLAKRIPPYSILVSCIATVGLVCINTKESHTNQQINSIIPYSSFFRYYLYQKMLSLKDYLINLGRGGTATLNVNTKIFGSIKIIKPTDELLFDYDKQVSPLFNKIEANQQESRRLAELRDTLLPKLMSGELKVNEIVA